MTPALFDLPLRTGEAAALASIVLEHAEDKTLNDDLRIRIASRAQALKLSSIQPWFGSLEKDPIHPSTYYLAVDGLEGQPLLMHMAPAIAPSSGLFPKAILIGRMQAAGAKRREIVVNASPFGPGDAERIRTFAGEVNRAFLPRPQGNRPAILVRGKWVESDLPSVFEEFRSILKAKGANVAGISAPPEVTMWAAIRTGWREGYTLEGLTRFSGNNEEDYDRIRQKHVRGFDFELDADPEDLGERLRRWKEGGRSAQLLTVRPGAMERIEDLAAMARQYQAMLSVDAGDRQMLDRAAKAANGRVDCKMAPDGKGRIVEVFQQLAG